MTSLGEVGGDGPSDPGLDHAVHVGQVRESGHREVGEDVGLQGVLADDEEDLIAPAGVVPSGEVEDDGDEAPDILHADGLGVQIDEGGGFMCQNGMMKVVDVGVDGDGVLALGVGIALGGNGVLARGLGVSVADALGGGGGLLLCGGGPSEGSVALCLEGFGALLALGVGEGRGVGGIGIAVLWGRRVGCRPWRPAGGAQRSLGMARDGSGRSKDRNPNS